MPAVAEKWSDLKQSSLSFDEETKTSLLQDRAETIWLFTEKAMRERQVFAPSDDAMEHIDLIVQMEN